MFNNSFVAMTALSLKASSATLKSLMLPSTTEVTLYIVVLLVSATIYIYINYF